MDLRSQLSPSQDEALQLLEAGWRFSPGLRRAPEDLPPEDLPRGYPMRAHPPGTHAGAKPKVEQVTVNALIRRGLARRIRGGRVELATPRMSKQDKILFLLLTDWTILRTPEFQEAPPIDLNFGPAARLIPPAGYTGGDPGKVFQGSLEALVRRGSVALTPEGRYILSPDP